jgi:hypothetical protein
LLHPLCRQFQPFLHPLPPERQGWIIIQCNVISNLFLILSWFVFGHLLLIIASLVFWNLFFISLLYLVPMILQIYPNHFVNSSG